MSSLYARILGMGSFSGEKPTQNGQTRNEEIEKQQKGPPEGACASCEPRRARPPRAANLQRAAHLTERRGRQIHKQRMKAKAKDARGRLVGGNGLAFVVNTVSMIE